MAKKLQRLPTSFIGRVSNQAYLSGAIASASSVVYGVDPRRDVALC